MVLIAFATLSLLGREVVAADAPSKPSSAIEIAEVKRAEPVDFAKDVLPILRANCIACHNAKDREADLVLETPDAIRKGGETGPAVVAGKGMESLLLLTAAKREKPFMPPKNNKVGANPLTPQELGLIRLWIDQGAKGEGAPAAVSSGPIEWHPLPEGLNPIYAVAVSNDAQLAACNRANQIFVYSLPRRQLLTRLTDPALQASLGQNRPGVAHRDLVQSLAFSPDGKLLASGGYREVKFWQRTDPVVRFTLTGQASKQVNVVATSPDGQTLAVGSDDTVIRLFSLPDGKPKGELKGHAGEVTSLQFSEDGAKLFSGSADKTARVWSVSEAKQLARVDTPNAVTSVLALRGRNELLSGGGDNAIRRWSIPEPARVVSDVSGPVTALTVSPDRKRIAVAGGPDNVVHLVDVATGKSEPRLPPGKSPVRAINFDADGKHVVAASGDGAVLIGSMVETKLSTITAPGGELTGAALRPDAKQVATATGDGRVTLWRLDAPAPRKLADADESRATALAVSPNNQLVATATTIGGKPAVVVRKVATGEVTQKLLGAEGAISAIAFSPDNARVFAGGADKSVRVWTLADGKEVAKFAGHAGAVTSVAIHSDNTRAVSASADGGVKVWSTADGKEGRSIPGHSGAVVGVALLPNNQLATASADRSLNVFDLNTGAPVRSTFLNAPATALAVSRDGARIAVATGDKSVRLISAADGAVTLKFTVPVEVTSLSFSLDGTRLTASDGKRSNVFATLDGGHLETLGGAGLAVFADKADELIVADEAKGVSAVSTRFARTLSGITKPVSRLLYTKDGSLLIVASVDGTVRAFNPADGVAKYAAVHGSPVRDVALSPDGAWIASGGEEGLVKLWATGTGAPAAPKPQLGPMAAAVASVAFSADGARVVAASTKADDVVVFDREQGVALEGCDANGQAVTALAVVDSPKDGGDVIAMASADKSLRIVRTAYRGRFDGHAGVVTSLAPLPGDASKFLSGSADGTVRQWNLASPTPDRQFAHGGPVSAVAVRPDGKTIASAGGTSAKLFDFAGGKEIATLKGDRITNELAQLAERQLAFAQTEVTINQQQFDAATQRQTAETAAVKAATDAKAAAEKLVMEKQTAATAKLTAKQAADKALADAIGVVTGATSAQASAEKSLASAKTAADAATTRAAEVTAASRKRAEEAQALANAVAPLKAKSDAATNDAAAKAKVAVDAKAASDAAKTALESAEKAAAEAKAASEKDPGNEALKQAAAAAEKAASEAAAKSKAALESAAAAQKAADEANAASSSASQALAAAQKVADDASSAAKVAALLQESAQKAAAELATASQKAAEAKAAADAALAATKAKQTEADTKSKQPSTEFAQADKEVGNARLNVASAEQSIVGAKLNLAKAEQDAAARKAAHALAQSSAAEAQVKLDNARKAAVAAERTISGVAFSPDNVTVIAGDDDGAVRTFSAETGAPAEILRGHANAITAVAFAPDGTILSGSADRSVKSWDANPAWTLKATIGTGDEKSPLADRVLSLAFSPDGTLLATGGGVPSRSGELKLWSVATGQLFREFPDAHSDTVYGLSFSGDGKLLASGGADKFAKLWDVYGGKLFRSFEGHTHHVLDVSLRHDARVLATAGADNAVKVWDVQTGEQRRANQQFSKFEVTSVGYVGFTDRFVATSGEGIVRLMREADLGIERAFDVPGAFIYSAAATPDGTTVLSGGYDSVLRIRDARDGKTIADFSPPK